jgi:hypothetical protein
MTTGPTALTSLDLQWVDFVRRDGAGITVGPTSPEPPPTRDAATVESAVAPLPGPLNISTKTKIVYLSRDTIDLETAFWKIDVPPYASPRSTIIKKQMKVACATPAEAELLRQRVASHECATAATLRGDPDAPSTARPYVAKVNVGLCRKDLSAVGKPKGAFYNCFMLVVRIRNGDVFQEVNLKVFNTGKVSFPGMLSDQLLADALRILCTVLSEACGQTITHNPDTIETVLINSNFNCGFYLDRAKLADILKYEHGFHVSYDPCSYPGIQSKYFMTPGGGLGDGVCRCPESCAGKRGGARKGRCREVSFMVFRTGSVLIVGHCDETALGQLYGALANIVATAYPRIAVPGESAPRTPKSTRERPRRRTILVKRQSPPPPAPAAPTTTAAAR